MTDKNKLKLFQVSSVSQVTFVSRAVHVVASKQTSLFSSIASVEPPWERAVALNKVPYYIK